MRKLLIVLLALIAISVVGWFGVYQIKAPDIQADIKQRVGEALASNSLDWVDYAVDGRDVTLNGVAQDEQTAQHALDTADIYGLNSLKSNISVVEADSKAKVAQSSDGSQSTNSQATPSDDTAGAGDSTVGDSTTADSTDAAPSNQADATSAGVVEKATDVVVQDVATDGVPALPIAMNISRDAAGEYIFSGTVPDMELKQTIDQHLTSVGADPRKAVWQVDLSSAKAPKNWPQNIKHSISAIQLLEAGEANLTGDQAVLKGISASQDVSDAAEVFAQQIAGDYTTDIDFSISDTLQDKTAALNPEGLPLVGSDQYAAKFCQTEFNALIKQQKIVFDSGSSNLQSVSTSLLDKVSQVAAKCANQQIQVHGYTDSLGSASANEKLSKSRAEAVVIYLEQKGISAERLAAVGHGEKNPVASNKTKAGRAQNRRIELIVKGLKK